MNRRILCYGALLLTVVGLALTPSLWRRPAPSPPMAPAGESRDGDPAAGGPALEEGRARVSRLRSEVSVLEQQLHERRARELDPKADPLRATLERAARRAANHREWNANLYLSRVKRILSLTAEQEAALLEYCRAEHPDWRSVEEERLEDQMRKEAGLREFLARMVSADRMADYDRKFTEKLDTKKMFLDSLSYNLPEAMDLTQAQHDAIRDLAKKDGLLCDRLMKLLWYRVDQVELKDMALTTTQFRVLVSPLLSEQQGRILDGYLDDRLGYLTEVAALRRRYLPEAERR